MDAVQNAPRNRSLVLALSILGLLAGSGGMAVSFLFLSSRNRLDVVAGEAGFIAGAVLVAAGLISLAIQSESPKTSLAVLLTAGCIMRLLPSAVAILAWPVLYFTLFLSGMVIIPYILIVCLAAAWPLSGGIATELAGITGWRQIQIIHTLIFVLQALAILGSFPLFILLLNVLGSMGYKVGWS